MKKPASVATRVDPRIAERVLDNMTAAMLLFDRDLYLRYINPAGETLLSVSANAVLGVPAGDLVPCPSEPVEQRLRDTLQTRHPYTEREVELTRPDGQLIRVNCTVLPLHQEDGRNDLLMELYQVDRQIRITREEHLLAQHRASQALLRGLAHEIKNPLGGLRGAAQLLERELPNTDLREYTRIIIDEADRLQNLLNRMLGPNQLPQVSHVNIHHVLEHVRGLITAEFPQGPSLVRDYDPSIPDFEADSERLIQALLNIVRNGAEAAGEKGQLTLRTRVLRQFTIGNLRHRLVLSVEIEDNGPGIPESLQDRIFFPMVSGRSGGTGLGLPIAQELINQHDGLIECESRPHKTQFFVYLPLRHADEQAASDLGD
ncbi:MULTISPECIES: nitrogen regulation protein NR(II) [Thiorhodovibrio]|uniref:nitrogen regulation protein NR(II) n=1 Tax=Thiorhodovibrio TaxID=61593 RepID=UPI00191201F1|nr:MULTISPECIES: nitrogen regulation protein NR(II) [Thiorhodovibrio]MBK5971056.1 two-component system sensor histidine kinase NtrB [Thiorhodovibrio winogradskyi]WPL10577.1 Nitrogen regulation protein NR(II) [Thiorhodovibrio litoralis]